MSGIVYLNTETGDDNLTGWTYTAAVKTYARAVSLVEARGKIRVCTEFLSVYILSRPHEWSNQCRKLRRKLNQRWA